MSRTEKNIARRVDLRELKPNGSDDVLVVGSGGREHAIVRKLRESAHVRDIYGAPGNDGMDVIGTGINATDIDGIVEYVETHSNIKLTVVVPDDPLAMGLVDRLSERGHRAFGPTKAAAKLEWSKAYAKDVMRRYGVPTAEYGTFADPDGPVEQFLSGYEVSLLTFVDGKSFALMPTSCDHKRALDGDKGLNTGGMGAYSPCPVFGKALLDKTVEQIVAPTVEAMAKEGAPFKGVLYFGLMVEGEDVRVLEFNARFGDPETQCVLPLLQSDLYEIFNAVIDGRLSELDIKWSDKKSINVVLASGGSLSYKKGCEITGLTSVDNDVNIFYAGVKHGSNGFVTNGGRVLCVQAVADDFGAARRKVYDNIQKIKFENCIYRKDIGSKLN